MCGRYATSRSAADISAFFEAYDDTPGELVPSWNVAPTDPVPVVRISGRRGGRVLNTARWGLVPPWAPDLRGGPRMINARAETVATSPAFAPSFARRRCLVPADGWYEWVRRDGRKQPYYMTPRDGSVLAFAGLWSAWGTGDEPVLTCSVLTTAARGALAEVHDRMPVPVPVRRWDEWLNGPFDAAILPSLTPEALISDLEIRSVGAEVGNVRHNGPQLTAPRTPATAPELRQESDTWTLF
jgi:putative SOS response-associated peptidase YedK